MERGFTIGEISKIAGHDSIFVTQKYYLHYNLDEKLKDNDPGTYYLKKWKKKERRFCCPIMNCMKTY